LTAFLKRAFDSTSPLPPVRAATVISLISLVKILPRFASSAPYLCLIVCHLKCPDIYLSILLFRFILDSLKKAIYHADFSPRNLLHFIHSRVIFFSLQSVLINLEKGDFYAERIDCFYHLPAGFVCRRVWVMADFNSVAEREFF